MPVSATFSAASERPAMTSGVEPAPAATEGRISWLTLLFGFAAALLVAVLRDRSWGLGLAIGAALAWLNFRWLRRGLDSQVIASTAQADQEKPKVPLLTYFAMLFRYGLLALSVYVIYNCLHIPLGSMVVGMCALAACTKFCVPRISEWLNTLAASRC